MTIINSKTFQIGTSLGMYAAGTSLTDNIISLTKVSCIIYKSQAYNSSFVQNENYIDFSSLFSTSNGDVITLLFENPIKIK